MQAKHSHTAPVPPRDTFARRRLRVLVAAVTAAAAVVAGCGATHTTRSSSHPPAIGQPPSASAAPSTLPPGELGTYVRRVQFGTVALKLSADGRYTQTLTLSSRSRIHGVWSFHAGTITFTETGGKLADCAGTRGTYRWSYANTTLTLKAVNDDCADRNDDFPQKPWRKSS
jgi:hypothetical protein